MGYVTMQLNSFCAVALKRNKHALQKYVIFENEEQTSDQITGGKLHEELQWEDRIQIQSLYCLMFIFKLKSKKKKNYYSSLFQGGLATQVGLVNIFFSGWWGVREG